MAKQYSLKQTSSPHRGGKSFAVNSNGNEGHCSSIALQEESGATPGWPAVMDTLSKQTREPRPGTWSAAWGAGAQGVYASEETQKTAKQLENLEEPQTTGRSSSCADYQGRTR